jgi:NAD-dependent dihydropyrimidine dehydrogenase PreA subunit
LSGIPRDKIPWYPTIDYDKCTSCLTCAGFCKNGVYSTEGNPEKPVVSNPYRCVVGCSSCSMMCPAEAISFPSKEEIVEVIKRLRAETER